MKAEQVIAKFISRETATAKKRDIVNGYYLKRGASISTDGTTLYSYWTPIARWDGAKVLLDGRKFSVTTSKQQGKLRYMLSMAGIETEEFDHEI